MSFFLDLLVSLITVAAITAIAVAVLSIDAISDWFRERVQSGVVDRNKLCVTILKQIKDGDYQVVQGIFDSTTMQNIEERTVTAKNIDADFLRAHDANGRAVWQVHA